MCLATLCRTLHQLSRSKLFTAVHARSLCCCQNTDKTSCSLVITMNIYAPQLDSSTTVYSNSTKKNKTSSQCRQFPTYARVSFLQTLTSLEFHICWNSTRYPPNICKYTVLFIYMVVGIA